MGDAEEFRGRQGGPIGPPSDPPGWLDGAPTSGRDQSCAFCSSRAVRWVHPLDPDLVAFRVYGKGHTLPSFWTLCQRCEDLYRTDDDSGLLHLMVAADGWSWETAADVAEHLEQALAVFRRADRGSRQLVD